MTATLADDIADEISSVFLVTGEHAVVTTCTAAGGTLTGIWQDDYYAANPEIPVDIMGSTPALIVAATASTGLVLGDVLTHDAINYQMVEFRPDGQGMVDIRLQKS